MAKPKKSDFKKIVESAMPGWKIVEPSGEKKELRHMTLPSAADELKDILSRNAKKLGDDGLRAKEIVDHLVDKVPALMKSTLQPPPPDADKAVPCPTCGGKKFKIDNCGYSSFDCSWVECEGCGHRVDAQGSSAVGRWNEEAEDIKDTEKRGVQWVRVRLPKTHGGEDQKTLLIAGGKIIGEQ